MKYDLDLVPFLEGIARDYPGNELILVQVVGDIQIHQIGKLGAVGEIVHHHYVLVPGFVQGLNQIAADESGAASDYDHVQFASLGARLPTQRRNWE